MEFVFVCVAVLVGFASADFNNDRYSVPEPIITVYPKGFDVSIPDDDGIQLFAFHGNKNKRMDGLAAGQFSKDILEKTDGRWVFKDRTTKLHPGDKIYYWLFVIRNNLGYRYDKGELEIKGITKDDNASDRIDPPKKPDCITDGDKKENIPIYDLVLLNLTQKLIEQQDEIKDLQEKNVILMDIVEASPTAHTLIFGGLLPYNNEDALYVTINILKNSLDVSIPIKKADYNPDRTITFEVESLDDKINIIKIAKEKLKGSRVKLSY